MKPLVDIYRTPLGLLTDLYQLTMAYGYWKMGRAEQESVFHLFFRKSPFGGGYAIAAGLSYAVELMQEFRFERDDLDYLATLTGNDGEPLFDPAFLEYLADLEFTCDVDAVPEGTVVFPHEPLVRVRGPILQAQLLETALLNIVNFQTLVATKAARVCQAANGDPVMEFGLRRAQGIDGALTASRAAYLGGCAATSNVLAGKLFSIPVKGTHAHSWVMSFDEEPEAFEAYAQAMPNNCVFLVDTYDTLAGVRNAIEAGLKLRDCGHEMVGIRLDSGDLAYLSIEARKLLDEAGFPDAAIVASNDLDEYIIEDLKRQGAMIAVWGVGTKLATAYDQPALGGVYKLGAIRDEDGAWQPRVKLSDQAIKTSIPGTLQVRRFENKDGMIGDLIFDETSSPDPGRLLVDPGDPNRVKQIEDGARGRDLLVAIARGGVFQEIDDSLESARDRVRQELERLHPGVRRFTNAHNYPVGLEPGLHALRGLMIRDAKATAQVTMEQQK
ncbi:MAG: nicotinate phosphoribosyltransferase [Phycisphaeraceae bacterium]